MSKSKPLQVPQENEPHLSVHTAAEYLIFVAASGHGGVEAVYADEKHLAHPEDDGAAL